MVAKSQVSEAAPSRISSGSDVVRDFYNGINRRDLESVELLIGEDCVYEDLVFSRPFVGRKVILKFCVFSCYKVSIFAPDQSRI